MALFPRISPLYPLSRVYRDELSPFFNLFNDTFNELQRLSNSLPTPEKSFAPKFDVKETDDTYELHGELPGIKAQNLTIEFADENNLTIRGRTEYVHEEGTRPTAEGTLNGTETIEANKGQTSNAVVGNNGAGTKEVAKLEAGPKHTCWISERGEGEFARSFTFPTRVNQDAVKASLKDGVLSIVAPKLAEKKASRKIQVQIE